MFLCSGFAGFEIAYSDLNEDSNVTLRSNSGTVLLSPTQMQFWQRSWDRLSVKKEVGVANELKLVGSLDAVNFALKFIHYFGYGNRIHYVQQLYIDHIFCHIFKHS